MSSTTVPALRDSEHRPEAMTETIDAWIGDLLDLTDEARTSAEFQAWLDVHSRFHEYSFRNTLLIKQQCPDATKVAGYRTWQTEFDRQVRHGESAIWIWAPIITECCPTCGCSQRRHDEGTCAETTSPDAWPRHVVGYKPVPVFDVSQTDGVALPTLETTVHGQGKPLLARLLECASDLDVSVELIDESEWPLGTVKGVCHHRDATQPRIAVKRTGNFADMASTLVHEYAHALLHMDRPVGTREQAKCEVEAESIAYVVGRHFGLNVDGSALYIARWHDDSADVVTERLSRISATAQQLIPRVEHRIDATM